MPKRGETMPPDQRAKIAAALTRDTPASKQCPTCGNTKPADEFGRRGPDRRLLRSSCRECERCAARDWARRNPAGVKKANARGSIRRTGLTEADFDRLMAEQGGACAICRRAPGPGKRLHIDHSHGHGHTRGLLCSPCNVGLGGLGDSIANLEAAISYLRRYESVESCNGEYRRT